MMVASARLFGFSSFSMLLPQALMGVGTVALTSAGVKRWSGRAAGLVAGALVALTPVAALMFRFGNPDALLVFLMTAAVYFVIRAIEGARKSDGRSTALRWLLLAGSAIGFAFLTKMFQGLLVLPAFGLAYLVAANGRLWTRIWHLLAAAGALVVSAGWFVALVAIWPTSARPYIGGSTNNSLWELAIGYNGLSRILGGSGNGRGGGGTDGNGGNTSFGGASGIARMFGTSFGSEISWLLPAALLGLVAGLVITRRAARTDKVRAGLLLWGGWLVVTALVLSFMSDTVHPYYAVAVAPAIAAVVAVAGRALWTGRHQHLARVVLAVIIAGTAAWSFYLLGRDAASWLPWLRWVVLIGGLVGAALLAVSAGRLKKLAVAGLLVGSLAAVGATGAFTVATAATGHTGSIPVAGPPGYVTSGMGGGMGGGGQGGGTGGGGTPPTGTRPTGTAPGGSTTTGSTTTGQQGGGGCSSNSELTAALNKTTTTWSAAVIGDQTATGYILSTDTAVMAIGGWSGSDNSPTLTQFEQYVKDGKITYLISSGQGTGGGGQQGGGTSSGSAITSWSRRTTPPPSRTSSRRGASVLRVGDRRRVPGEQRRVRVETRSSVVHRGRDLAESRCQQSDLARVGDEITGPVDTVDTRRAGRIDDDVTALQRQPPLRQRAELRVKAQRGNDCRACQRPDILGLRVGHLDRFEMSVGPDQPRHLGRHHERHAEVTHPIHQPGMRTEAVPAVDDRHAQRDRREHQRPVDRGVAATDDDDVPAGQVGGMLDEVQDRVAGPLGGGRQRLRAERADPTRQQHGLRPHVETGPGTDNDTVVVGGHRDRLLLEQVGRRERLGLGDQVGDQVATLDPWEAGHIEDVLLRVHGTDLAAGRRECIEQRHRQSPQPGVERTEQADRPGADDEEVGLGRRVSRHAPAYEPRGSWRCRDSSKRPGV